MIVVVHPISRELMELRLLQRGLLGRVELVTNECVPPNQAIFEDTEGEGEFEPR